MNYFSLQGRQTVASHYDGIPEFTVPGLHSRLFDLLRQSVPDGASVVDLATGAGAWARRLIDHGYRVTGCDIDPQGDAFDCIRADLNEPFADKLPQQVDAVTCIEMLEHVENPRHILREGFKLLRPGGTLLLSTPNASGLHSRVKFLATGRFAQFDDRQYDRIGHMRPITFWELDKMLREAGFSEPNVHFYNHYTAIPRTAGEVVKLISSVALAPLVRGVAGGQVLIAIATKPAL